MMMNYKVYLMGVDLNGIHNKVDPSIEHRGKRIMRRRYNNTPSDTVFILKTLTKAMVC